MGMGMGMRYTARRLGNTQGGYRDVKRRQSGYAALNLLEDVMNGSNRRIANPATLEVRS